MNRPPMTRGSLFGAALLAASASLFVARSAHADQSYPQKVKDALDQLDTTTTHCVPQCTLCHRTSEGGAGTTNVFGSNMVRIGKVGRSGETDTAGMLAALMAVQGTAPATDSDGDGTDDVAELEVGDAPAVAGPAGVGQICADIRYGCGAHIAPPPQVDRWGIFAASFSLLGFAVARRRRSAVR